MQKIARYFQLLIFVTYLAHGFIPHHHHKNELSTSYNIEFSHDAQVCVCHGESLHSGEELHDNCLLCDQLQKERTNNGFFFKEPVLALYVEFQDDFIISSEEESTLDYPLTNDLFLITDAVILNHGLRAPPLV
jgi:hypothetical protein